MKPTLRLLSAFAALLLLAGVPLAVGERCNARGMGGAQATGSAGAVGAVGATAAAGVLWSVGANDAHGCKPQPPLQGELKTLRAQGRRIDLLVRLSPRQELQQFHWRVELPPGAQLLAGLAEGEAVARTGVFTEAQLSLQLPAAGGAVELVLSGSFEPAPGRPLERVERRRIYAWGPTVLQRREPWRAASADGARVQPGVLPVAHRAGR